MQLHLHPTRQEALTASSTALTCWSLATNPATILAQMATVPHSVLGFSHGFFGPLHTSGGVTGSPDGKLFVQEHLQEEQRRKEGYSPVLKWRHWNDLSLARACSFPTLEGEFGGLAHSPDGHWLVLESAGRLYLLDWQTGEILSHHTTDGSSANRITFDATSTFVAVGLYGESVLFELWRLDPTECFVPRPPNVWWPKHLAVGQDEVEGHAALTFLPVEWTKIGGNWPYRYLPEAPGLVAFSPDSRLLLGSLHAPLDMGGYALATFEVPSGRLLWEVQEEGIMAGDPIFSPDGRTILIPELRGDLAVFRVEDGALLQRLSTNLGEPVQTLAFDHDRTLWLATADRLVQYQPQG